MKAITQEIGKREKIDTSEMDLSEKLVALDRVTKVVKGGKNMHFRALVVVGDGKGHVGMGLGKAKEVPDAIRKAGSAAKKDLAIIKLSGDTVPHEMLAKYGAAKVLIKPAMPGTGVIAGGGVRAVLEAAGIKDVLTKSLGSEKPVNVVKATMLALVSMRDPKETVAKRKANTMEGKEKESA